MAGEISILAALALEIIKLLTPDQLKMIQKKINELDKDHEEERQKYLQALKSGDADILTEFLHRYL